MFLEDRVHLFGSIDKIIIIIECTNEEKKELISIEASENKQAKTVRVGDSNCTVLDRIVE